jgi:uncharacterized SAM-binding protein YcdF (DUF218 family)
MERKRFVTTRRLIILLAILALAVGVTAFRGAGRWLVREDPLVAADAIVVLSGSMPQRAEGAADLYRSGYAPEVWVTRPDSPQGDLAAMGIQFIGEEEYSRQVLIHRGVRASAIRILPDVTVNTEEEIEEIARELQASHKSHVIIVTSAPHTRRVRTLWSRLAASNQTLTVEAAAEDPFDRDHWWRNTHDAYAVVREMMGLINAWAGLTVRPRSPRT